MGQAEEEAKLEMLEALAEVWEAYGAMKRLKKKDRLKVVWWLLRSMVKAPRTPSVSSSDLTLTQVKKESKVVI